MGQNSRIGWSSNQVLPADVDAGGIPVRVLILVHGYPPQQTGGAERRAARTAQRLVQRGYDVMVLAVGGVVDRLDDCSAHERIEHGVRVRRISLLADRTERAFLTSYDNPQTAAATAQAIADFTPDVVHLFSGYLMSASAPEVAIDCGVPVVVSLTDYWWLCHRITLTRTNQERCCGPTPVGCARCQAEMVRRYRLPTTYAPRLVDTLWLFAANHERIASALGANAQIERRRRMLSVLNRCTAFVSPSQYLADFYIRYGVDPSKMRVWRQGVDVDRCTVRARCSTMRFGCLGQVKRHKGVDLVLDAWRKLTGDRKRRLYIYGSAAGESEYAEMVRRSVDELDDVSWPGEYRGREVWDILSRLDVLVVPSRWVENSPNSILEAQAAGVPVVATSLGALPELVDHGHNGLLFGVDDAEDLAAQLQQLLDEPELVGRLRDGALPFKTIDQEIDELCGLYAGVTCA